MELLLHLISKHKLNINDIPIAQLLDQYLDYLAQMQSMDLEITSEFLAESVNVNPVVIRRLLGQLKAAGLIQVQRGSGGASVAKPLEEITFFDVYRAVECIEKGELFHFHENPSAQCPVGRNIHHILDDKLQKIQDAMEQEMKKITIADVMADTEKYIAKE